MLHDERACRPFTTPLECERELPKALQGAVTEYAELSLGPEAAAVRLPDDDLQQLVRDRWTEVRPMEIGGSSQDMFTLHALVVFDLPMQQAIERGQRLMIGQRVKGAAVVFGGVLGLLALAWGGLRLATAAGTNRETLLCTERRGRSRPDNRSFPPARRNLLTVLVAVLAVLAVLGVLAFLWFAGKS